MFKSYIAIGDSFTEGLGDPRPDGSLRGWADRVAEGLAYDAQRRHASEPVRYANLAIRGRKLLPILDEQLDVAISQQPELISVNGGGNDMMRPSFDPEAAVQITLDAVKKITDEGIHVLLLAGPDPSKNLPLGKPISVRGRAYTEIGREEAAKMANVTFVDNFHDRAFEDSTYWSPDGLHLERAGHLRVAANCLDGLGLKYPPNWGDPRKPESNPKNYASAEYMREYVAPWVGRRIMRKSSGDGRSAKIGSLENFLFDANVE